MDIRAWRVWVRNHRRLSAGLTVVAALLVVWARWPATGKKFFGASKSSGLQAVGFYENHTVGSANPGSWSSLQSHWRQLSSISPHWFAVNLDGSVTD
ncbi:MAG: hypothetical protein ACYCT0_13310, partial [Sulfobacillus sp.]